MAVGLSLDNGVYPVERACGPRHALEDKLTVNPTMPVGFPDFRREIAALKIAGATVTYAHARRST